MNADFFEEISWLKLTCAAVYFVGFLCVTVFSTSSMAGGSFFWLLVGFVSAVRLYVDAPKPMRKWHMLVGLAAGAFLALFVATNDGFHFSHVLGYALIIASLWMHQRRAVEETHLLEKFEKVS